MGHELSRRSVVAAAGSSIVAVVLPSASAAASPGGSIEGGQLEATSLTSVGGAIDGAPADIPSLSVRTNSRRIFEFTTSTGGTLNALMWQFAGDPVDVTAATTARASFHTVKPTTAADGGSAQTPNIGVMEAVSVSFDAPSQRIILTSATDVVIPIGTFYITLYGTGANIGFGLTDPSNWTSSPSGAWSFVELDGGFQYAPRITFGVANTD
jgi:hypothetical protein